MYSTTFVKQSKSPPTTAAADFYGVHVFLQSQTWQGRLNPLEIGMGLETRKWKIPSTNDMAPASKELLLIAIVLKIVHWSAVARNVG